MKSKRAIAVLIAIVLVLQSVFMVFAKGAENPLDDKGIQERSLSFNSNPTEYGSAYGQSTTASGVTTSPAVTMPSETTTASAMTYTAELITEGEQTGLFITLHNPPSDIESIKVEYSFGGLDYFAENGIYLEGDFAPNENGDIRLFCYGLDEHPVAAFLSEAVNSLYIKIADLYMIDPSAEILDLEYPPRMKYPYVEQLKPVRFSHNKTYEIPQVPPPFSANFKIGDFSYDMMGHFEDFQPNIARMAVTYSWDGTAYQHPNPNWQRKWKLDFLGKDDPKAQSMLQNQYIAEYTMEPLKSFLAGETDFFYVRLEITTEEGEVYYSQPAYLARSERQPLPEHLTPRISLGFNLSVMEIVADGELGEDEEFHPEYYTHGELQLTVQETITKEELTALLPDTVPVRVRIWDKNTKEKYVFADLSCDVKWKTLPDFSLQAGETLILEDMAEPLMVPAGTEIKSALGSFLLKKDLYFKSAYNSDDIHLILNPIGAQTQPDVALHGYNLDMMGEDGQDIHNMVYEDAPMRLAFWNKPSGATSIQAYTVVGDVKTEIGDLLDRRKMNHNQSHALYGYVEVLQPDEYPYEAYLSGALEEFSIALEIQGGAYDGKQVTLPWPMNYNLPQEIYDPYGMDGQENNAGSSLYEEIDEDDENDGGQRPELPSPPSRPQPPDWGDDDFEIPPTSVGSQPPALPIESVAPPVEIPVVTIPTSPPSDNNGIGMAVPTAPEDTAPSGTENVPPSTKPASSDEPLDKEVSLPQETPVKENNPPRENTSSFPVQIALMGAAGVGVVALVGSVAAGVAGAGQMTIGQKLLSIFKRLMGK